MQKNNAVVFTGLICNRFLFLKIYPNTANIYERMVIYGAPGM